MMRSDLALYLLTGVCLILLLLLTHWRRRRSKAAAATPKLTRRTREPKPFAGYTHKPECRWCEQGEGVWCAIILPDRFVRLLDAVEGFGSHPCSGAWHPASEG